VSITRWSPNSSRKPCVTRKTPPRVAMSSPSTTTRSSPAISSCRVSWIAVTTFFWVTRRPVRRTRADRGWTDRDRPRSRPDRSGGRRPTWSRPIGRRSPFHAGGRVVGVGGGREEPVRLGLDQGRPLARPGPFDRGLHRRERGQDVVPVHDDAREPVAGGTVGDVLDRHLERLSNADRVVIVLAHEDHGQLVDPREVQALVPGARAGRPLAEPAADHGVL